MFYPNSKYDIQMEWGIKGIEALLPISDIFVIIDVLSFSTSVDIVISKGSKVLPYKYKDNTAIKFAKEKNALLANYQRSSSGFSLSPSSLLEIPENIKIVLPSPNGSTLSLLTENKLTICACLRNYKKIAGFLNNSKGKIAIIPAGEKWDDNSLRPAIEDLLCAGAIISELKGSLSPESEVAARSFKNMETNIETIIENSFSGRELKERGFVEDIKIACQLNISQTIPILENNEYIGFKL